MKFIFPGSFDPFHKGHFEILKKGLEKYNEVTIIIANNCKKNHLKSLEKRKNDIKNFLNNTELKNIEIRICNEKYLADFMKNNNINNYIRGIRNIKDYIYEKKLYKKYKKRNKNINLHLIKANNKYKNYSSSKINKKSS